MKIKHSYWRICLDWPNSLSESTYVEIIKNGESVLSRPTRKSADKLAQKLADKYNTPFYYMNMMGKKKPRRKAYIVLPSEEV